MRKSFFLNGQKYFTENDLTLFKLVKYFNYNTSLLVIEYNHLICNKIYWNNIFINENDKVEIITIVGGG